MRLLARRSQGCSFRCGGDENTAVGLEGHAAGPVQLERPQASTATNPEVIGELLALDRPHVHEAEHDIESAGVAAGVAEGVDRARDGQLLTFQECKYVTHG